MVCENWAPGGENVVIYVAQSKNGPKGNARMKYVTKVSSRYAQYMYGWKRQPEQGMRSTLSKR
ncbi:hypothetical protein M404DRAFT_1001961 [Pisolithus tinctorius Marx 270]|uniref:Uncharacterized protein n=1 Tax=Pisolithus tinctorius Marx 270 TaxID=870435 RepID=A0A0C3P5F7_PISTI|nr:hypothetical protein M404DRAFT_1001961 [Pisolithus tinctorius Marx 270]